MPKIFNVFQGTDPLGATLADMGRKLYGDGTANAIKNEQLYGAQRENTETDNLMRAIAQGGGAQALGSDPLSQAMMVGSGYDPKKFGEMGLMGAATQHGARDPRTQDWQVGTGQSYDNTAGAFDLKLGETARSNDMESADRRYGTDQSIGQQMYEFGNVSANDAVKNTETFRSNNLASSDRRYGVDVGSRDSRYGDDLASSDRRYGTDQTRAQQMHEFDNKPMPALGPDGPIFTSQIELSRGGFKPILSNTEQQGTLAGENFGNMAALPAQEQEYLSARVGQDKVGTLHTYLAPDGETFITVDGRTDHQSGQPLPPQGRLIKNEGSASDVGVTNAVQTDLQSNTIANKKFKFLIGEGLKLTQDPTLFGPQGWTRSLAQEVAAGVAGIGELFAPTSTGGLVLNDARETLAQTGMAGMLPELYDPNLPKVVTVWGLLVYQGAAALAGQENRSVSDKDIAEMKGILGSPQSFFSSAQMMESKLNTATRIVDSFDTIAREALGGAAPVAPVPTAQERWERGPDGVLRKVHQ